MKKKIILFSIFCLLVACSNDDPYQGNYLNLSFEENLVIDYSDSLSEATLNFVRDVRVGPEGNIYAADAGVSKVKVYSPEGELVNSFGGRGRGPGEFTDIRGFALTDSTTLVWDQSMQRLSMFGLDGEFQATHKLKGVASPMLLYPLEESYLAIHMDHHKGDQIWNPN